MSGTIKLHFVLLLIIFTNHFTDCHSTDVEPFLEYHFHTFFEVDDPEKVAHAIKLRNEIIANCVDKKIIAIPLHYNYNPENPVREREC